jgi:hypothetical protein
MADSQSHQQLALFVTESKVISEIHLGRFNNLLAQAIADGYIQLGTPFVWGNELAVNVVKIDQRITDFTKKVLDIGLAQLAEAGL